MKQLRGGRLGLLGLGLGLFVSGCDFSNNGLGAGAPAVDRGEAGSGGSAGRGGSSGGRGGSGAPAPSTPPPMDVQSPPPSSPPPPPAPVDAGPDSAPARDDGSSGIKTIDAAPAVDSTPPPMPAAACPANAALLLCLDFEGGVRDQSEPAAPVTVRSVVLEPGPSGQAGRVTGNSQIALPSGVGLGGGAFTIEAWLRPDGLPSGTQRAGVMDKQGHFGLFVLPGGDVVCYSQGAMATAPAAARAGQWISAGCTVGGGTVAVWINGERRAMAMQASGAPAGEPAIAIGSNSPTGDPFTGLLDNVRIWAGTRSSAEICQLAYDCD